jgi:hypothetical protein
MFMDARAVVEDGFGACVDAPILGSVQVALKDSLLVLGKFVDTKGVVQDGIS